MDGRDEEAIGRKLLAMSERVGFLARDDGKDSKQQPLTLGGKPSD